MIDNYSPEEIVQSISLDSPRVRVFPVWVKLPSTPSDFILFGLFAPIVPSSHNISDDTIDPTFKKIFIFGEDYTFRDNKILWRSWRTNAEAGKSITDCLHLLDHPPRAYLSVKYTASLINIYYLKL